MTRNGSSLSPPPNPTFCRYETWKCVYIVYFVYTGVTGGHCGGCLDTGNLLALFNINLFVVVGEVK
jgi:hypothetical protein